MQPNREAMLVEVEKDGHRIKIANTHLNFWRATCRYQEFRTILSNFGSVGIPVLAGDLNIFDSPWGWPNWALNSLTGDSLAKVGPWFNERRIMEQLFFDSGFSNAFAGMTTYPKLGGFQLDHVLVPSRLEVLKAEVIEDLHGSDHHPISIRFELA